jgi:hypothetical protein
MSNSNAHHGPVVHEPSPDAHAAYRHAYDSAQPDPGRTVVSIDLEARETDWEIAAGRSVRAWGYNGQVPGPFIEARVGDVLEVRLTNRLPEPTTIHWHGLRVPAAMDGTDMVQRPIGPGESFTYRFRLPDAGTFDDRQGVRIEDGRPRGTGEAEPGPHRHREEEKEGTIERREDVLY